MQPDSHQSPASPDSLLDRYLRAQLVGNRTAVLALLNDELEAGTPVGVLHEVIAGAQRRIGELWQENRISIAQEHVATAISQLALAVLFPRAERDPAVGRKVMVACVEGELHDFPARLAADALDLGGFDVMFLGANVPTDSLIAMVLSERPHLLALSCTMSFHLSAVRAAVQRVREVTSGDFPIVIGGHAFTWAPEITQSLHVAAYGKDARELVRLSRELLGVIA